MEYHFNCPMCLKNLTAETDVGEHIVDWSEKCDDCGYIFSEKEVLDIYDRALEDAWGSMIDNACDYGQER